MTHRHAAHRAVAASRCLVLHGEEVFEIAAPFTSESTPMFAATPAEASDLLYATFLGGSDLDSGRGIAVDSSGHAYVTGRTFSSDFPTTPGAFDTKHNGIYDAFVVKLNPTGTALIYATFLGGSHYDYGYDIAVDSSGHAYVTGEAGSSDFPTTPGAFDTTYNNWGGAFVVKLALTSDITNTVYLPMVIR